MKKNKFENSFSEEIWRTTYKDFNDTDLDSSFRRIAKEISKEESTSEKRKEWEEKFYILLSNFCGVPGGRIISNAGTKWKNTYHNCFVGPRENYDADSIEGILSHLKNQVLTLKAEGGWGENFSYIRPRGSFIHGIGVESPGAVKYMELFDKSSDVITSGSGKKSDRPEAKGKIRKGAMMGVLDIWHPDILEFIGSKQQQGRLEKFNISVNCTDKFMNQLEKVFDLIEKGAEQEEINKINKWDLIFPETTHSAYKSEWFGFIDDWLAKGYPIKIYQTVKCTDLWDLIMKSTYNRNDPGILFLDRANYFYPANYVAKVAAVNPCGEQMLPSGDICNLGSLNLTQFLNKDYTDFDYEKLQEYAKYLVRFLDNVNSLSTAPVQVYEKNMRARRRIGCGLMGWGSALYMMQIKFASNKAAEIRRRLLKSYAQFVYCASIDLAIEKGQFTECNSQLHANSPFIKSLELPDDYMEKLKVYGIRNSSCLSIQPTGNTSIFANIVSGGCEPVFAPEYIRTMIVSTTPDHIKHLTPQWQIGEFFETEMFKFSKEGEDILLKGTDELGVTYKIDKNRGLTKEILCEDYGVKNLKERGLWNPNSEFAATALSLTVDEHLSDYKDFCEFMDSACSKTVNLPEKYSFEDFKKLYLEAYKTGFVKGITTYRQGTMATVLSLTAPQPGNIMSEFKEHHAVKRPKQLPCELHHVSIKGEKWLVIVGLLDGRPYEVFGGTANKVQLPSKIKTGELTKTSKKNGFSIYDLSFSIEEDEQLIIQDIVDIFDNVEYATHTRLISLSLRHGTPVQYLVEQLQKDKNSNIFDFSKVIARCLKKYIKDGSKSGKCENCSSDLIYKEGCISCINCGWSKCS